MPNPGHLFRVVNEFVFMLVGALLALFALTGRYLFNPRRPEWIALSVLLIVWGLGTWRRAQRSGDRAGPAGDENRGRVAHGGGD